MTRRQDISLFSVVFRFARDLCAKVVLLFGVCKFFSEKMQIFCEK